MPPAAPAAPSPSPVPLIDLNVALTDAQTGAPVSTGAVVRLDTWPPLELFPPVRIVNAGGPGTCNFYHGAPLPAPIQVCVTVDAAGYVPWTNGQDPLTFGAATVDLAVALQSFRPPFRPAPRRWKGNLCGVRVPDLPSVPGGAADPELVLSWFYDRYDETDRAVIRVFWRTRGYTHVLLSWPDSRAVGATPQQFRATCRELIAAGFFPCVMLSSKVYDPPDVEGILANIAPVLSLLVGEVPMFCVGWELSLWLSPTQVQQLIDHLAPQWLAQPGTLGYVHFEQGYAAFQQPGQVTAAFWQLQVGKLTGLLHQKTLTWDAEEYQYRLVDILERFSGQDGYPSDSGFGHPFDCVAMEISAQDQFNGTCTEFDGDVWGDTALTTPPSHGVEVMGSGNGQLS